MDDVDDYNGKDKTLFSDWPSTLSSYAVAIVVTPTTLGSAPTLAVKQVTVTVTGGSNVVALTGYRANY
jgi:hypothetical protein